MSNAQEHHSDGHQSIIKTPKQLLTVVVLAILVPITIIMMLASYVAGSIRVGAGSDGQTTEAIDARIAPVAGFELVDANAPREFLTGEAVYQQVCAACHSAGVAGAPTFGDAGKWAPFIKAGLDEMMKVAINGKGAMPPRGGSPKLSDFELERAVVYMANHAGGSFPEPTEPAAEGAAPEGEAKADAAAAPAAKAAEPAPAAAAPAAEAPAAAAAAPAATPEAPAKTADAGGAIAISPEAATVGKKLYESTCFACHGAGVAGAPKLGDKAAWAPLIATGMDAMMQVAIHGKGAMPPRGTAMSASDDELRMAVEYMVSQAQ